MYFRLVVPDPRQEFQNYAQTGRWDFLLFLPGLRLGLEVLGPKKTVFRISEYFYGTGSADPES
jgi:hypothetical protein